MYMKDEKQSVAKAEMPVPAQRVYATALTMAEEKDLKILKKEDDKLYIEVTDGVQYASFKAEAAGAQKTAVTVNSTIPSEGTKQEKKTQEKELSLRIINRVCERLQVQCTISK